jgi:uncharacterized SAM-binding protein YcdF (DUF218 family)
MKTLWRSFVVTAALAVTALAFGFVLFASHVMREPVADTELADGIVVLTGPDNRISAGAALLVEGRARRMLISGVNRRTPRADVARISGLSSEMFECCVDLGYEALDTIGNADETRNWARANGFSRLIIVTSSYHMPRSMAELSMTLPDAALIPHSVVPRRFPDAGWWLNLATTRTLLSEYLKYLPAAARVASMRVLGLGDAHSVAVVKPELGDG